MKVEDVITARDTDDNVSDEGTNDGVARAPEQQNANSTYDSSPCEFISEYSSDKEETNKTSFRPGLLVSSTIMKKKKKEKNNLETCTSFRQRICCSSRCLQKCC